MVHGVGFDIGILRFLVHSVGIDIGILESLRKAHRNGCYRDRDLHFSPCSVVDFVVGLDLIQATQTDLLQFSVRP